APEGGALLSEQARAAAEVPLEFQPTVYERFDDAMRAAADQKQARRAQHKQAARAAESRWQAELRQERERAEQAKAAEEQMRENLKHEKQRLELLLKKIEANRESMRLSGLKMLDSSTTSNLHSSSGLLGASAMDLSVTGSGTTTSVTGTSSSGVGRALAGAFEQRGAKRQTSKRTSSRSTSPRDADKMIPPKLQTSVETGHNVDLSASGAALGITSTPGGATSGFAHLGGTGSTEVNLAGLSIAAAAHSSFWERMRTTKLEAEQVAKEEERRKLEAAKEEQRRRALEKQVLLEHRRQEAALEEERRQLRENIRMELEAMEARRKQVVKEKLEAEQAPARMAEIADQIPDGHDRQQVPDVGPSSISVSVPEQSQGAIQEESAGSG
ncbi:unnamed protein product, partial [Amoebophrya sp. A25]